MIEKNTSPKNVTREDPLDLGVPMLAGDASEPQGPEDALGPGPKRGDYSQRIGPADYHPHQVVPVENPKDGEPVAEVIAQRDRATDRGDEAGLKGGVETA